MIIDIYDGVSVGIGKKLQNYFKVFSITKPSKMRVSSTIKTVSKPRFGNFFYRADIMGFYDLTREERSKLVKKIHETIEKSINEIEDTDQTPSITIPETILCYASDEDTYIRKNAYLAMGRIYWTHDNLHKKMILLISKMLNNENCRVRQTAVYSLGEIGKRDTTNIMNLFETALNDEYHSVRTAVVGSLKQMG